MFPLTHLSLKIFPNGTAFDVIFVDSPIFNRNIVNRVLNMIQRKYCITTTYSNKGSIDTTNSSQRIIGQWKGILGFIVNYPPPPNNNNMLIISMCSHHWNDERKLRTVRILIASCKFLKHSIQITLVVLNLIFLQGIHRLFWIESHSLPNFNTAFGTDDSPNVCRIRCTGDWTISQNCFTLSSGQWSTFVRFPIAPSAHNLEEFFSE